MAFRLARLGALAVIVVASLALPAGASASGSSGGASAPIETGPGYDLNAPSGGAVAGAIKPRAPKPKDKKSGSGSKQKKKKKTSSSSRPRFPIVGPHSYGDGFGAPRSGHTHQGQDVLAAERTLLVAPVKGYIRYVAYQAGGAGNYVVMHASGTNYDFVFMHLKHRASVNVGQSVKPGTKLGVVGHTGDATGPHLHFEVWDGAWYGGGHPIDPLPLLRSWDR
jgi:murein DD-endopeptidase MepM/ murein hydrolase activator NlpD